MRGSDLVDLFSGVLPRRWVELGVFTLCVVMVLTGWYEPVTWYLLDKAQGLSEVVTPMVTHMLTSIASVAPAQP